MKHTYTVVNPSMEQHYTCEATDAEEAARTAAIGWDDFEGVMTLEGVLVLDEDGDEVWRGTVEARYGSRGSYADRSYEY